MVIIDKYSNIFYFDKFHEKVLMMEETKKVLYILGNGFDLNLGLKTSYNDFFEYLNINNMRSIINLVRKDRKNIEKYDEKRLEDLNEGLKKYDYELEKNDFFLKLKKFIEKREQLKIKDGVYSVHKEIISTLKSKITGKFVDEYGIFIIFLLLTKVEKNEWQWIEKQILYYIQDFIEILDNNFNELISYIKKDWDKLELELKKIIKLTRLSFKKENFNRVKTRYLESFSENKKKNIESIFEIISRKAYEYFDNTINIKEYQNYVKNLIFEIEYINFLLEILFTDSDKKITFKKEELKIVNENDNKCIYLKEQLYFFENYFAEYIFNINENVKKILKNRDDVDLFEKIEHYINFENKFLKIVLNKYEKEIKVDQILKTKISSKIYQKIKNFFKNRDEENYIINFNYTNYLNEFINNNKENLNIKNMININGDVENSIRIPKISLSLEIEKILKYINSNYEFRSLRFNITLLKKAIKIENIPKIKEILSNDIEKIEKELKKIEKIESKLIFGIDDIQIKDDMMKNLFKDFIKKNRRNKNEEKWKKLVKINKFSKIYFYGHSFADADYSFFEDLFELIDLENNEDIKLIFLYSSGFSCEKNVNSLIMKYALRKYKKITKLKDKLEIKEIN